MSGRPDSSTATRKARGRNNLYGRGHGGVDRVGALINYFITIPFYITVMGLSMEGIVAATGAAGNTMVNDLSSLIWWVFVPFNIFKGLVVSVIVGLIYKKLSTLLHR